MLPAGAERAAVLTRLAQLSRDIGDDVGFQHYQRQMLELVPPRAPAAASAASPDPVRGRALFLAVADGKDAAQPGLAGNELLGAIAELRRQVDLMPAARGRPQPRAAPAAGLDVPPRGRISTPRSASSSAWCRKSRRTAP